jgi:poly(3-hydroxyalkanoate) synthetase
MENLILDLDRNRNLVSVCIAQGLSVNILVKSSNPAVIHSLEDVRGIW